MALGHQRKHGLAGFHCPALVPGAKERRRTVPVLGGVQGPGEEAATEVRHSPWVGSFRTGTRGGEMGNALHWITIPYPAPAPLHRITIYSNTFRQIPYLPKQTVSDRLAVYFQKLTRQHRHMACSTEI
jgi:hypothetical protein